MNIIAKLKEMISGCENIIKHPTMHKDAKKLAEMVKKDCEELLRITQLEQGRIA